MTAKQIKATARQMRQLIDDARGVPRAAVGDHLTDDQFVAYSMEPPDLTPELLARVEQHLLSCPDCSDGMERLLSVAEAWRGPAGEKRLGEMSQRIRHLFVAGSPDRRAAAAAAADAAAGAVARLAHWLRQLPQCSAALGAVAAASISAHSPTNAEHLSIREDEAGNLRIRISSYDGSLAGTRVVIEPFGHALTLEHVAPDQVGAEVLIPASARRELAPQAMVGWRIDSERPSG